MRYLTILTYILLFITLISIVAGGVFFFKQKWDTGAPQTSQEYTRLGDLYTERSGNTFLMAENSLRKGLSFFSTARTLFEQSLGEASTPEQTAHIQYKIALTYTYEEPKKAIALMKELVANQEYPPGQKAYALQHMYRMYANLLHDSSLIPVIFEGDPYSSFYTPDDTGLSFKKFHQYTLSFAHVPISDTALAIWYAKQIPKLENADEAALKEEYLLEITQLLAFADDYAEKDKDTTNNKELLPQTRANKANIYANLARANIEDYRTKYGDEYVAVITQATAEGSTNSSARHAYAYFSLLMGDAKEWERARPLFDELIENIDTYPGMKKVYIDASKNLNTRKAEFVFMAKKYQKFKDLLIKLGWKEADFTT